MTPGSLNEVFQWGALGAILLLVLALYRQLGLMLTSSPEKRAYAFGPLIGRPAGRRLVGLFREDRAYAWKLLVFMKADCSSCETLLSQIEEWMHDSRNDPFDVAVVASDAKGFGSEVHRRIPGATVVEAERLLDEDNKLDGKALLAYPFSILISSDGIVQEKQVGSDGTVLLARLRSASTSMPIEPGVSL